MIQCLMIGILIRYSVLLFSVQAFHQRIFVKELCFYGKTVFSSRHHPRLGDSYLYCISDKERQSYRNELYKTDNVDDLKENLQYFRQYASKGIDSFRKGNLKEALDYLEMAKNQNSSQPLIQRGVLLYISGDYHLSVDQLQKDIEILESSKMYKASDLRLWLSACYNKLGDNASAIKALDLKNEASNLISEERYLLNSTLHFYGGERQLGDIMEIVDGTEKKDLSGNRFFGNFYLG